MHDFKPGDLIRSVNTRETGVVVENRVRSESWKRIFIRVHWFHRAKALQTRYTSIRHLGGE